MSGRLTAEVKDVGEITFVKLSGVIDEDNELGQITAKVNKPHALVDSADVQRINSCGVRDWVTWLGEMGKKGVQLYFLECSPAIMTQVNLVNNFVGGGTIVSFYAPYFCAACEADKMLMINVDAALKEPDFQAPTCRCDQCDHTMEFDDIESSYFGFLKSTKPPQIIPAVQEQINQLSKSGQGLLRTRGGSMPMPSLASATPSIPSGSTAPSSRGLKGLLTDPGAPLPQAAPAPQGGAGKILYIIVGLLVAAIGLLSYVVLRSSS